MSGYTRDFKRSNAAFLASFTIHCFLIVALAFCLFSVPGSDAIVLSSPSDDLGDIVSFDFSYDDAEKAADDAAAELNRTRLVEMEFNETPDISGALETESLAADASWMEELIGDRTAFTDAVLVQEVSSLLDTREIGFFGIEPTGNRIVYIIDMSVSMGYSGYFGPRYNRAVAEVLKSIDELKAGQQFYVYLFCFECYEMDIGQPRGVFCAPTDENRERLANWLGSVQLGAGTDPRVALVRSLELDPSCMFLLSDGEFNGRVFDNRPYRRKKTAVELARIHNKRGCPIHTIGLEDQANQRALTVISEQSGGKYKFVSGEKH